jgi:cohesin complex subunit SA-1/2
MIAAKAPSVAAQEYRKIFEEFWYQLGTVAMSGTIVSASKDDAADDDSDSENEESDEKKSSARFQVELVRDILSRLIEIMQVGLPDIRAAVCTAVYRLSVSVLEKTVELKQSMETAQRQLHVAMHSKSSRKADALQNQIESWKRTLADLEAIATETVVGSVFLRRYRDVHPQIRASSVKALSQFTLIRPDLFLASTYLKYFGWLLSDKDAVVREAAISALLAPFRAVAERSGKSHTGITIDLENMNSVLGKFLGRLADCVLDVDMKVQESAMQLLLVLLRKDLFDEVENDRIWEQINMRSIDPNTTPAVRRDALYFVIEQLEAFDNGSVSSMGDAVERINALVDW